MEDFPSLSYISHSLLTINIDTVEMCCITEEGVLPSTPESELSAMATLSNLTVFLIS